MSERAPQISPETRSKSPEASHTEAPKPLEARKTNEHQPKPHEKQEKITRARQEIEKQARTSQEIQTSNNSEKNNSQPSTAPISKELKNMMKIRTISRIQKELPPTQRVLSKVVHNKAVEYVSEVGEKTIARPSGLLGGGALSLLGSIVILFTAKKYGFKYNLLLFFLLFATGYIIATVIEIILKTTKAKR